MSKETNPKKKFPEPVEIYDLDNFIDKSNFLEYSEKSLWENIVNPTSLHDFHKIQSNNDLINQILSNNGLFEPSNFRNLYDAVRKIAHSNKDLENIEYDIFNPKKEDSEIRNLIIEGWTRHIFNIIYAKRAEYNRFIGFKKAYEKWRNVYNIVCSGKDEGGLATDLYNLGF